MSLGARVSRLVFLGTSSALPRPGVRNVSSMALVTESGPAFLLDCGEGTQHQLMQCSALKISSISAIFITHLHGDHCFGIFGLLCSLGMMSARTGLTEVESESKKDVQPLRIVGPVGVKTLVQATLEMSGSFLPYDVEFIELKENESGPPQIEVGEFDGFQVTAFPLTHRIRCFGYQILEPTRRGKFDPKAAAKLGVRDKKMFSVLANGGDVELDNGVTVKSADVLGPPVPGRSFALLQDTSNSDSAIDLLQRSYMIVHEATFDKNELERALDHGHSTSLMAGEFAQKINAEHLVLTHFSARYDPPARDQGSEVKESGLKTLTILDLAKEAQEVFSGKVYAAEDFMAIDVTSAEPKVVYGCKKK